MSPNKIIERRVQRATHAWVLIALVVAVSLWKFAPQYALLPSAFVLGWCQISTL